MQQDFKKRILQYTAIFEPSEEGGFTVTVPALPGCITEGDTFEEALHMVKDAIEAYLFSLDKHNQPIPIEEDKAFIVGNINITLPKNFNKKNLLIPA